MTAARPRARSRGRLAIALLAALGLAALALRPSAPVPVPVSGDAPRTWRGAYHVHSTRSDGSGSPDDIARAAARAGLHFVILTDHGDATRTPDHRYVHGVLLIDGVEVSTEDGHYVALGLPASPYPLAGEGRAVAEDVRRLGGIGILAHPDSPLTALAWHDWSVDADGFEWVNADSAWREAGAATLVTHLLRYPLGRAAALAALATYPATRFAERDDPAHEPRLALAAVDAHARIGMKRRADPMDDGRTLAAFPSYDASFGTFGLVIPWHADGPTGQAADDAARVVDAIRQHRASSSVLTMAAGGAWVSLDAESADSLTVRAGVPADATVHILKNGRRWQASRVGERIAVPREPAIYRAEAWVPARRGWPEVPVALGGAVRMGAGEASRPVAEQGGATSVDDASLVPAVTAWHGEHDPHSAVTVGTAPVGTAHTTAATLTLAPGARVSQFAALVGDLAPPPDGVRALVLDVEADAPMRLSIQVREPRPGEGLRWRQSAYVDGAVRRVVLPLDTFRAIAPATGMPPGDRLHALLLVMDTVNASPGSRRRVTITRVGWHVVPAAEPVGVERWD